MTDPLLQPTVRDRPAGPPPWHSQYIPVVAFFGGAAAMTVVALRNGRRLGLDRSGRRTILVAGALTLLAEFAFALLLPAAADGTGMRLTVRAISVLGCLVQLVPLLRLDRLHMLRDDPYASLWGPGTLAVLTCGVPEGVLLYLVWTQV
ncbi:hypothetical protein [Amycolatopsis suaedae]|uniref:Uncharacterized protein n=1 Tax=Amycolatopsis suaedae TaxID=2510978 RepID=A0A4Q7J7B0_9PSEU|nr:hypothetical protein [Amycolatopsis suaedae]RZQ62756.1 hypothetical protein EWH70_17555 [Amycolatopsis suaedae]